MRFNLLKKKPKMVNYEGAPAYRQSPATELYSTVVTASLSDQFYEGSDQKMDRIRNLIMKNDPTFVAKLAVYTREQMYMRSVPLVLSIELAKIHSGDSLVSNTVSRVVQRADEIAELLAYYAQANKKEGTKRLDKLSKQVQKGLATSFNRFDEYQFAKYNREAEVTLKDALFLVHPKAKDDAQQDIFNKIVEDDLKVPYTWETELSALGKRDFADDTDKRNALKSKWEELIDSNKLGYMATLRNLRNMLECKVGAKHMLNVCSYLTNEQAVLRSKQLPFRFLAAHRELKNVVNGLTGYVMEAIEKALKISVQNMKGFDQDTRVVIACDVSGSMGKSISRNSKVLNFDIGLLLGMLLQYKCQNVVSGMFGNTWKVISLNRNNVLSNVDEFYKRANEVGYATNGHLVLDNLLHARYVADKVMMFTDCQMWNSNAPNQGVNMMEAKWKEYKKIAPNAKLYLFDLSGYGNTPLHVNGNDVFLIAGWSDKIFDVLDALENGHNSLSKIEAVEL